MKKEKVIIFTCFLKKKLIGAYFFPEHVLNSRFYI